MASSSVPMKAWRATSRGRRQRAAIDSALNDAGTRAPMPAEDRMDRAWSVLLGAALCMFCSQAATILFTFGIFSPRIAAETGWDPVSIAGAIAPATIAGALLAPLVGRAADRYGPRRVAIIGGPAYFAGFALIWAFALTPLLFIACLAATCALGFAAIPVIYAQVASTWFARRRGLALSLIFAATSIGVVFWSQYATFLLARLSFREAYLAIGATAGTIILSAGTLLLRDAVVPTTVKSTESAVGLTTANAFRTLTFWKFVAIFTLLTGILAGCTVTLPTVLQHFGATPKVAASAISVVGVSMLIGRLSAGVLLDRWFAPFITAAYVSLSLVGMVLMLAARDVELFLPAAALLGLGLGSEMDAAAYMVSRAFGRRAFGGIYGLITLAYGVSGAIGTGVIGSAIALGVAPAIVFAIGIGVLLVVVVLLLSLRRSELSFDVAE